MSDFRLGNINFSNLRKEKENSTPKRFGYLSPLCCDTVSFGALKKSQFRGIDLLVVNKFKAPIEKFNTNEDLQNWCKGKVEDITKKDYKGRQQETQVQRKAMLKEWFDYVQKENEAYNDAIKLLILDGITKNLKPDEDSLPPVLNKGILADTISQIQEKAKNNPKSDVNFSKMYQMNLQKSMLNVTGDKKVEDITGWVVIPSKINDPEHFEENVEKLKLLSHNNWCTKSFNAEPYLSKGDFHVYLENGKPKLGVRFAGDEIQEIQGEMNNSKIPVKYFDIAFEHVKGEKLSKKTSGEIKDGEKTKEKVNEFKKKFPNGIENTPVENILNTFGIKAQKDKDGLLIISEYHRPDENFTFADLGISENKLLENVKAIEGKANFCYSQATNLGKLQTIGGDADFGKSEIKTLGNLQTIGGFARFEDSQITDLGNLQTIEGTAYFKNSNIKNLKNLKTIGKDVNFDYSNVTDLGNLQTIGGNASFGICSIESLGKLQTIGGNAHFYNSFVSDLGELKTIGKNATFFGSWIKNLGKLQSIGGDANFVSTKIIDLGNIQTIGGNAYFKDSAVTDLGNLQAIGGDADFGCSEVTNLGNLQTIGGSGIFNYSKIKDLGNLQTIGGNADFGKSVITDFGKLQTIGGNANFDESQITNLGNLQVIRGRADFRNSEINNLGKLQTVGEKCYVSSSQTELIEELKERKIAYKIL